MNKTEVAEALGCSPRQVEKYASPAVGRLSVEYVKGKRGREARYDPAEVKRLRVELEAEREEVIGQPPAIAVRGASQVASVTTDERLLMMAARMAEEMIKHFPAMLPAAATVDASMLPASPAVWLTIDQAAGWLGLPKRMIVRALRSNRDGARRTIRTQGAGRGLRLHALDVRAHFEA